MCKNTDVLDVFVFVSTGWCFVKNTVNGIILISFRYSARAWVMRSTSTIIEWRTIPFNFWGDTGRSLWREADWTLRVTSWVPVPVRDSVTVLGMIRVRRESALTNREGVFKGIPSPELLDLSANSSSKFKMSSMHQQKILQYPLLIDSIY
jgi:hypothetical protein